jgi:hypothetical protein
MIKAIAIVFKFFLLFLYVKGYIQTYQFVFIYNPLSAIVLSYGVFKSSNNSIKAFVVLFLDVFLPVVGLLAMGFTKLLAPFYKEVYRDAKVDVYDLPFGESNFNSYTREKHIEQNLDREVLSKKLYEDSKIQPYLDIFSHGELGLKINAIEKLSKQKTKNSIFLLKLALDDENYEVRYFSNNALEKIEKSLLEEIEILDEDIMNQPTLNELYNQRAHLYLNLYLMGLGDESTNEFYLEKSLHDYIFSLQLNFKQDFILIQMVKIHLFLGKLDDVVTMVTSAIDAGVETDVRDKLLFYRAEAYYKLGDWKKVKEDCRGLSEFQDKYADYNSLINWWGHA